MNHTLVRQQQVVLASRGVVLPTAAPWRFWDAGTIAWAARCPAGNVVNDWPIVYTALERFGIADRSVQAGVIGTIAIETASTFKPVREAYWLDDQWGYERAEAWRRANLRYWPYYGRGYVQLTWESNYATEGAAIGIDLVSDPDRALEPWIAADALARYFALRPALVAACRSGNWPEVRRLVQGAYAGLDRLYAVVRALEV
jgi:hypothetical protein